ncbi:hypothetical protein JMUB7531_28940 [Staphylococcus aureus]
MGENVLICLCGSVNSINISHYIIELKSKFDEVNVIASTNGRKFINGEILKQFCDNYFFSSRRRHTRSAHVSWARRCV